MDDDILISRLRELYSDQDITKFTVLDFLSAFGSPLHALMYARLFWPEFVEIEGMIFLKATFENDNQRARMMEVFERYGRDRYKTEQAFNLLEIPSGIFGGKLAYNTSEEEDYNLATILAEMWRCRLEKLYPRRHFVVKVLSPSETGGEVGIIFYQEK